MSLTGKPALAVASLFVNDGFWPDLNLGELMSKYRIPAEYDADVIKWGLTLALVNVNLDLEAVKIAIINLGHVTANAYMLANPKNINGMHELEIQYTGAVYAYAKAQLLQQFNSMNRKPNAEAAAKDSPETEQYWLDESAKYVAQLFAKFLPLETKPANHGVHAALI